MKHKSNVFEAVVHGIFLILGLITVGCVLLITIYLIISGIPAIRQIGLLQFLFGKKWASTAAQPEYGILPFILTSVYGTAGARDLVNLRAALEHLPEIKRCLTPFRTGALGKLDEQLETLEDISGRIAAVLVDEPPFSVREGGMIREGYDDEVDRLRGILSGGKGFIAQLEAREKEKTGIRTLKVGYNKVFGYYIEVSNSFKDQVPADYIRKQTLVNGERYITQELKDRP